MRNPISEDQSNSKKDNSAPKVSVIMGAHNAVERVDRSIQSIILQTFTDWEFIICDDGSDDDTFSKLLAWKNKDNRIISIKNEVNQGLAATLNHCLEHASGEYIARMDDDDISLPNRFDIQVGFLDQHPEYALVGGAVALFDECGVWGSNYLKKTPDKIDIYKGKSFCHPSVMIRRDALTAVGGYTVTSMTLRVEDYDLWCKMYTYGYRGANLGEIVLKYRRDLFSQIRGSRFRNRVNHYKLAKKWRRELELPRRYVIDAYLTILKGLVPTRLIHHYHRSKMGREVREGMVK